MKKMSHQWAVSIVTVTVVLTCSTCIAQDLPSVDEVFANYTRAIGGEEALAKVSNATKEGSIVFSNGLEGSISIVQDSGKYLMVAGLDGGDVRRGSDGEVVWEIHPSLGARLIDGKLKDAFDASYGQTFPSLAWTNDFKGEITCTAVEEIDGRENFKVVFKPEEGYEAVRFFDKETGLLTKLETWQEFPQLGGEVKIVAVYSDYQKNDGILMPMNQAYAIDGSDAYTLEYSNVAYNSSIDEAKFALPDAIQALVKGEDGLE